MRHAGKVVSKTMIVSHVWDYSFDTGTNAVDVLVYRLREKIDRRSSPSCFTRCAALAMFSRWRDALRHALALRLGLWYAGLFAVSAVALPLATYLLLARALAAQDHDVLASMLPRYASEYQRAGLPGLQRMVEADASEGRHERLLVRVVDGQAEPVYFAQPPGWSAFDLSPPRRPRRRRDWATLATRPMAPCSKSVRDAARRDHRPGRPQLPRPRRAARHFRARRFRSARS